MKKIERFEVGDECFDTLHKIEAKVLYVHPKSGKLLIEHVGDGSGYLAVKDPDEVTSAHIEEMTVAEVSAALGKRVKIVE
jgi:hypothetical protein